MPFSRESSLPRDRTYVSYVSCIGRWFFLPLSPSGKPLIMNNIKTGAQEMRLFIFTLKSSIFCLFDWEKFEKHKIILCLKFSSFSHKSMEDLYNANPCYLMGFSGRSRRPGFDPWVGEVPWRREWLSTSVFLFGEFHGQRKLAGYSPWDCKVSDTTEWLTPCYLTNIKYHECMLKSHKKILLTDSNHRINSIDKAAIGKQLPLMC